jgi:RHS repeat-associated protein
MNSTASMTLSTSLPSLPVVKLRLAVRRQCFLYGRTRRNYAGKGRDAETGLYYYGARYLDPRAARWAGGDPALGEYVSAAGRGSGGLPGMGGVYNTVNLHVYHYAGNNPVKYTDPDGRTTEIDESTGKVKNVTFDFNFDFSDAVIAYPYSGDGTRLEGPGNYIGDSFQWNSFEKGNTIHQGVDKTEALYANVKPKWESKIITALKSLPEGYYDIKKTWGYKAGEGFIYEGKYASMRDFGNILAGINAKVGNTSFKSFQRMAGAVHFTNEQGKFVKVLAVIRAFLGTEFGPPPLYGEEEIQYNASHHGYHTSFYNYTKWKNLR